MDISAIICTRNRSHDLVEAIQSVWNQDFLSRNKNELIIVDNGSTDETRECVMECIKDAPLSMRYVFEETPGLSRARNTGAEAARGNILAYLDSDAIASSRWMASLFEVYQCYRSPWVVGGPIRLKWPRQQPSWFTADMQGWWSGLDLGSETLDLTQTDQFPYGANYSCLRTAWEEVGGFSESFTLYNDEYYFSSQVRRLGGKIYYTPNALVWHMIPKTRSSRRYLLRRNFLQGKADYLFHHRNVTKTMKDFAYRFKTTGSRIFTEIKDHPSAPAKLMFWMLVSYQLGILFAHLNIFVYQRNS